MTTVYLARHAIIVDILMWMCARHRTAHEYNDYFLNFAHHHFLKALSENSGFATVVSYKADENLSI